MLPEPRSLKTIWVAVATGLLAGVFVMLLHRPCIVPGSEWLWRQELLSYDWRLVGGRASEDIVIVAIDEESIGVLRAWPWKRDVHARLIDILSAAGAKAIGLDIVFSEVSSETDITVDGDGWLEELPPSESDMKLEEAISVSERVILAAEFQETARDADEIEATVTSVSFPYWRFEDAAAGVGVVNFSKDVDSAVRRMSLDFTYQDELEPSFALEVVNVAAGSDGRAEKLSAHPPHPYLPEDTVLIDYVGPCGTFETVPYYQVLEGKVPDDVFKDKIVLVGGTAQILQDWHLTPMAGVHSGEYDKNMSGVEIQANCVATLLGGKSVWPVPLWVTWLVSLLFGVLTAAGTALLKPLRALPLLVLPLAAAGLGVPCLLLRSAGTWLPIVSPMLALVLSYSVVTVYMYVVEERHRRAIRAAWQRRVAPEILDVILENPELAYVSGKRTVATTLFSDVRGFTTMCDALEPEEVVAVLNEYLSEMTKVIRRHRGTIHKFIGDGIMAVFGDPIADENHADEAVAAALEMQQRLAEMRDTSEKPPIQTMRIGVGVHTGALVAGDIGSEEFMEYTIIGATVSIASRLEGLNKELGTGIIISEATKSCLHGDYAMTAIGPREIRGVAEPIEVYAVTVGEVAAGENNSSRGEADHV
jgi:adenylate cyclase